MTPELTAALREFLEQDETGPLDSGGNCLYCSAEWSQSRAQFGGGPGIIHDDDCDWKLLREAWERSQNPAPQSAPEDTGVGVHDHLEDGIHLNISMDVLVRSIIVMPFGAHRLLSALVRARREDTLSQGTEAQRLLTLMIEDALNRGGY